MIIVDWLSFTIPINTKNNDSVLGLLSIVEQEIYDRLPELQILLTPIELWERVRSRPPYNFALSPETGIAVFFGMNTNNILIEISGQGCEWLRSKRLQLYALERAAATVTRFDLALDIETDVQPAQVRENGASARFRAFSTIVSETGATEYFGSKISEYYVRVYRYYEPHPRAKYLRAEFVWRHKKAQSVVGYLLKHGEVETMRAALAIAEFKHTIFASENALQPIEFHNAERPEAKTVLWLIAQCAPAFKKLVEKGIIENPQEFLNTHFLSSKAGD